MQRFLVLLCALLAATVALAAPSDSADASVSVPTTLQAIYAVPSDVAPVAGRTAASSASISVVQDWFSGQTGGQYPVFTEVNSDIDVQQVVLSKTEAEVRVLSYAEMTSFLTAEIEALVPRAADSKLFVYLESPQDVPACGYAGGMIVIPMANCGGIYPSTNARFPYGDTYLVAHELTHLLGAVPSCAPNALPGGHLDGDNRDILYQGSDGRDWDNLMLDPGNDDYYNHGRSDCYDIANSPLLGTWQTNGLSTPSTPTTPVICDGLEATVVGTTGDDVLTGTAGADVIAGLQGNDLIRGLAGDDVICGGIGDDVIYGGADFDIIFGAQGNDRIYAADGNSTTTRVDVRGARMFGGAGNDIIYGTNRWDRMQGGSGADTMYGYEGRDWMRGGGENDVIDGGSNIDDLHGGNGNDRIAVDNADIVRGGAGALDRCVLTATADPSLLISCELR